MDFFYLGQAYIGFGGYKDWRGVGSPCFWKST